MNKYDRLSLIAADLNNGRFVRNAYISVFRSVYLITEFDN